MKNCHKGWWNINVFPGTFVTIMAKQIGGRIREITFKFCSEVKKTFYFTAGYKTITKVNSWTSHLVSDICRARGNCEIFNIFVYWVRFLVTYDTKK